MIEASTKISKYFTYGELWHSDAAIRLGINNEPTPEHYENLKWLANNIGDKCRDHVGGPLHASFYRSSALNAATPGASIGSYHMYGMAFDIDCKRYGHGNNADLFRWAAKELVFANMIWEYGNDDQPDWIHITAYNPIYKKFGMYSQAQKHLTRCIDGNYSLFNLPL